MQNPDTLRNRNTIHGIAIAHGLSHADADDVEQDVLIRALLKGDKAKRFGAWLNKCAANYCVDVLRRPDRRVECLDPNVVDGGISPVEAAMLADRIAAVHEAVDSLPEPWREVVTLHHCEGMPLAEIAVLLALPVGTIKSRLARAREALRLKLDGRV